MVSLESEHLAYIKNLFSIKKNLINVFTSPKSVNVEQRHYKQPMFIILNYVQSLIEDQDL